ncbi:MAG: HXXEE domain-containing protein [Rhodanobacter sp.]
MSLDLDWPWSGAVAAAGLLVLLFGTSLFRTPGVESRWRDPAWLAVLAIPVYMLHQVEEYGIDVQGVSYAFRGALCAKLGFPEPATCPIPLEFFTAVNVGSVWIATVAAAAVGRRRPLLALSACGIALVNALTHIAVALHDRAYNPGLLTAVLLFVPFGLWALKAGRDCGISRSGLASIVLGGVLVHAVLVLSLLAYLRGMIGAPMLVDIQICNAGVPLAAVLAVYRMGHRRAGLARSG